MPAVIVINKTRKMIVKVVKSPLSVAYLKANLSTKKETHYEVLEVAPNATHNEIKSAYYKLTLKYHPDKNNSDYAKQKFQQISEAYEVIGNYAARKHYDRNIMVRQRTVEGYRPKPQKPVSEKVNITHPTNAKIFNFDEWTRMHYQDTFQRDIDRRQRYAALKETKKNAVHLQDKHMYSIIIMITLILVVISNSITNNDNDVPIEKNKRSKN